MAKTKADYELEGRTWFYDGKPCPPHGSWQTKAMADGWQQAQFDHLKREGEFLAQDEKALPKADLIRAFKQGMVHGASPHVKRAEKLMANRDRKVRLWMQPKPKRGFRLDPPTHYIKRG